MKVLHLVPLHVPSPGIVAQAMAEQVAADIAGLSWTVRIFTHGPMAAEAESLRIGNALSPGRKRQNFVTHVDDKLRHRRDLYKWLHQHHSEFDVVLLRHTYADISRARALRRISTPIFSVHHTLEVPELALEIGIQGKIREILERALGPRNIRASAGIVGVTEEIARYEQERAASFNPLLVLPNGLDIELNPLFADNRGAVPELIFVASKFAPWHGLDRLLDSVESSNKDFVLHLVGRMSGSERIRAENDSRVHVHGLRSKQEIAALAARSWVGLSSFALDRIGMTSACTLKVREYLSSGLVTYSGYHDVFPPSSLVYRQGAAEIGAILQYAEDSRAFSRAQVRELSKEYVSKALILERFYSQLQEIFLSASR